MAVLGSAELASGTTALVANKIRNAGIKSLMDASEDVDFLGKAFMEVLACDSRADALFPTERLECAAVGCGVVELGFGVSDAEEGFEFGTLFRGRWPITGRGALFEIGNLKVDDNFITALEPRSGALHADDLCLHLNIEEKSAVDLPLDLFHREIAGISTARRKGSG